jgi:hypothetical protein
MLWVRVLIWVALFVMGVAVITVTIRGGLIPQPGPNDGRVPAPTAIPGKPGEMAYDRFRPGGRGDPQQARPVVTSGAEAAH